MIIVWHVNALDQWFSKSYQDVENHPSICRGRAWREVGLMMVPQQSWDQCYQGPFFTNRGGGGSADLPLGKGGSQLPLISSAADLQCPYLQSKAVSFSLVGKQTSENRDSFPNKYNGSTT